MDCLSSSTKQYGKTEWLVLGHKPAFHIIMTHERMGRQFILDKDNTVALIKLHEAHKCR